MAYELRRLLPRQFADWPGTYMVDGDLHTGWADCRIVDISSAGAGLELLDAPEDATEGRHVFVSVHLRGEIRNSRPGKEDRRRVGIQFVDLSEAERAYLASLSQLEAHW